MTRPRVLYYSLDDTHWETNSQQTALQLHRHCEILPKGLARISRRLGRQRISLRPLEHAPLILRQISDPLLLHNARGCEFEMGENTPSRLGRCLYFAAKGRGSREKARPSALHLPAPTPSSSQLIEPTPVEKDEKSEDEPRTLEVCSVSAPGRDDLQDVLIDQPVEQNLEAIQNGHDDELQDANNGDEARALAPQSGFPGSDSDILSHSDQGDNSDSEIALRSPRISFSQSWRASSVIGFFHRAKEAIGRTPKKFDPFDSDPAVSEYQEELLAHMRELEEKSLPDPEYMESQGPRDWKTRQALVDWLFYIQNQLGLLPQTLWLTVNIIDRFLAKQKRHIAGDPQLGAIAATSIAGKYEEVCIPTPSDLATITGDCKEDVVRAERIILDTLNFRISQYCPPLNWMGRMIEDSDDDRTRKLSRFLTEVTLLDYRFIRVKSSFVAAVAIYTARMILGKCLTDAVTESLGCTIAELAPLQKMLVEKLAENDFDLHHMYDHYDGYTTSAKLSKLAVDWAKSQASSSPLSSRGAV